MIAAIRGTLEATGVDQALVAVGGIVLRVSTSGTTLRQLGEVGSAVTLRTHLHVREDALQLFGFASDEELLTFETLIAVTGIGPRLALALLSAFTPSQFYAVVQAEDTAGLSKVPGVGRKTAARIILELRGKLTASLGVSPTVPGVAPVQNDVVEALLALGYTSVEAVRAAEALDETERQQSPERQVFAALRRLGHG